MSEQVKSKVEVDSLYVIKAIFALVVVAIHTPPLERTINSSLMSVIAMAAVPIFFAITGYFLYSTDQQTNLAVKTKKMLIKVLRIWLVTNVFYFIYHTALGKILYRSWSDLGSFFAFGMINEGVLWYLHALVYTLVILYLLFKIKAYRVIDFLPLLGFVTLLLGRYSFLLGAEGTILLDFNVLSCGLPYVTLGFYIHKHERVIVKYNWEVIFVVILCFSWLEMSILGDISENFWGRYFFTMPLTAAFLSLAVSHKEFGRGSFFSVIGKKYSGNIYYFHFCIIYILRVLVDKIFPFTSKYYEDIGFILVFCFSLLLAHGIVWVQDRLNWSILR